MSFIISLYVREGIVMASDSRLSLSTTAKEDDNTIVNMAVAQSDSVYKTFIAPINIGITTFGAADINGVPIAGFIDSFIKEELDGKDVTVDQVPDKLLTYFRKCDPPPATHFHVAGYMQVDRSYEQKLYVLDVLNNKHENVCKKGEQGAYWGGESDILSRIIMPTAELDVDGALKQTYPYFHVQWQYFTLQDAIDFAVFAIHSTIEAMRFQPRPKTVGGPIDVLVVKPDKTEWIQRKALTVR